MRLLLITGLVCLLVATSVTAEVPPLWGNLAAGPYPVGFQVLYKIDFGRSYFPASSGVFGRPIRIMIWYPAAQSAGPTLKFSDYINVNAPDKRYISWSETLRQRDMLTSKKQFSQPDPEPLVERLLNSQTAAHRNAPPVQGLFPLVLHSVGRNDHQQASTVLWEYLASHGYVVANVPQVGRDILHPRLDFTLSDIALQREDIEFALAEMLRFPVVDASRIAIAGHSAGPVAGVLLAAENHAIDAVVSLDGSIATEDGSKIRTEAQFDVSAFRIPLLNIYRANETHSLAYFVDSLVYSDRYNIAVDPKITHFDFANWPLYSIFSQVEDPRGTPFRPAETARRFHLNLCRYVLHFLNATLKGETSSLAAISGKNEPRNGLSQFSLQQGMKIMQPDDLVWQLLNGDKNAAFRSFEMTKKNYPDVTIIAETGLNALGTQLLETERTTDALSVFELYSLAYPDSVSAQWGLAEAYRKNHQTDTAVSYYRKVVKMTEQIDEKDASLLKRIRNAALERLKSLEPENTKE